MASFTFRASDQEPQPFRSCMGGAAPPRPIDALRKATLFLGPAAKHLGKIVASSTFSEGPSHFAVRHSLVDCIYMAYSFHHNLILRPDDFWGAILVMFSKYVQAHSEELRHLFVAHQGQAEIRIEVDGTMADPRTIGRVATQMADEVGRRVKDPAMKDWVVPAFTTTTPADHIVFSVLMMATMQKYFSYVAHLCCGIPHVTLLGTEADWNDLVERVRQIPKYEAPGDGSLTQWTERLLHITTKLASSRRGNDEAEFWATCCTKEGGGSEVRYLSGWATAFCSMDRACVPITDVPLSVASVPVVLIDERGVEHQTEILSGGMVCEVSPSKLDLQPRLDWLMALVKDSAQDGLQPQAS